MTVRELIKQLKHLEQDSQIWVITENPDKAWQPKIFIVGGKAAELFKADGVEFKDYCFMQKEE